MCILFKYQGQVLLISVTHRQGLCLQPETGDSTPSLSERLGEIRQVRDDLFCSLHAHGSLVWSLSSRISRLAFLLI